MEYCSVPGKRYKWVWGRVSSAMNSSNKLRNLKSKTKRSNNKIEL
jgi:hypothetical protein